MTARVQQARTNVNLGAPANGSLLPGQLFVEMGTPLRLWTGVDAAINPNRQKLIFDANQTAADLAGKLSLSGGTMTGNLVMGPGTTLTLAADPASAMQPVTLQYYNAHLPVAASTTPLMDGTAAPGVLATWARGDHVHPTDTTRAPLNSPAFTGVPTAPTPGASVNDTTLVNASWVNGRLNTSLAGYLPLSGGTISGNLAINNAAGPILLLQAPAGQNRLIGGFTNASTRWYLILGDNSPETGGSAGSNFGLNAYDDGGNYVFTPLTVYRNSGLMVIRQLRSQVPGQGFLELTPGGGGNTGYVGFFDAGGTRKAYVGYADGNTFNIQSDGALLTLNLGFSLTQVSDIQGRYFHSSAGFMADNGAFYVGGNTNYYLARNGSNGEWDFVENGQWNFAVRATGDTATRGSAIVGGVVFAPGGFVVGNPGADFYLGFGGSGRIQQFAANWYWDWNASTGALQWVAGGQQAFAITADRTAFFNNTVTCVNLSWGIRYSCGGASTGNAFVFGWNIWPNLAHVVVDNAGAVYPLANASDARLKTNIAPSAHDCLDTLSKLRLVKYDWLATDDPNKLAEARKADWPTVRVGLVAQEVNKVFPEGVHPGDDFDDRLGKVWGLDHNGMIALLVGAIQQLAARIAP